MASPCFAQISAHCVLRRIHTTALYAKSKGKIQKRGGRIFTDYLNK
jgi:hypothetical protein